uniref:Uncharacterized protein n=1 Tax=Hemiselmis tepida TaxID=464990 RepID=A0A7S0YZ33_9CRYP|mmetsp:Transcript_37794/g.96602  ORF Transcript_37794/g.96602 Transcript_37794/m.96602 type:complete len:217 (+) Transcript_37794:121-771(+)
MVPRAISAALFLSLALGASGFHASIPVGRASSRPPPTMLGGWRMQQQQPGRREALLRCLVCPLLGLPLQGAAVAEGSDGALVARGTITVRPGAEPPAGGAVYVTARLAGVKKGFSTNRELSPIASIKIPVDTTTQLPLDFELSRDNLTMEGMDAGGAWWASRDLVLSARWDEDADANTRGPNDLVGRATYKSGAGGLVLELQGRGAAGKFATQRLR